MSQPPQYPYGPQDPYRQPPPAYGAPPPYAGQPYPGQPYAGQPYPAPQGSGGSPVGAFFLGFIASVVVAAIYSAIIVFTYKDYYQSTNTAHALYLGHALVNGAVVGVLVGLVGRRSPGAWIAGAVVAALGAFFGYADAVPFVVLREGGVDSLRQMLETEPFAPVEVWWGSWSGSEVISVLGLVVAAAAAWTVACLTGRGRR
ncbi:hypothetical protein [Kitasatospora sp. NPDC001527]|uniref:hypothetical protein n=1 Tax=Kitasatospora sp. NPDC001527 TaxID=3154519 RepID=UPI00332634D6